MKTPTIHFMDWAVEQTDNTGLINETGLVSSRKGGDIKEQLVAAFSGKAGELVSCWSGNLKKTFCTAGQNHHM